MFCNNCGKEIDEGLNFCTACGAKVGAPIAPTPVMPTAADDGRKRITKAVAALFAMLTVICVLLSGISTQMSIADIPNVPLEEKVANTLGDIKFSTGTLTMAQTMKQTNKIMQIVKRETQRQLESYSSGASQSLAMRQLNDVINAVGGVNILFAIIAVLMMLSLIALTIFTVMMFLDKKSGAFFGQLGTLAAALAAIILAIGVMIFNMRFTDMLLENGVSVEISRMLEFGASGWTYLAILFGATGFIFIAVRKNILRGE